MRVINIHVEGKTDLLFLCHFIQKHCGFHFVIDHNQPYGFFENNLFRIEIITYIPKSGNGGINAKVISDLFEHIKIHSEPVGVESIVIIDADTEMHANPKGGFANRHKYLENLALNTNVKFFIMPNHAEDGAIEDLLDNAVPENVTKFYGCLNNYVNCLSDLTENIPKEVVEIKKRLKKTKLDWYAFMMTGNSKNNDKNFLDNSVWNLDSPQMNPLKDFLKRLNLLGIE